MLYGVQFRNMQNAIHGIALFKKPNEAKKALKWLAKFKCSLEALENVYAYVDEINYRTIEEKSILPYYLNNNGYVTRYEDKVKIINFNETKPDIY